MRWFVAFLLLAGIWLFAAGVDLPRPAQRSGLVLAPLRVSSGLM